MNRYRFAPQVSMVMGFLFVSPCLLAQPHADVTIHGRVYYSGRHSGPIHIAAGEDWRLAGQVTIPGPGPYSLTIPNALAGHSYVVLAQMDLDGSGLTMDSFLDSFQQYEPSGDSKGCAWGGCNASHAVPVELFESLDIDIYLSDYEPACVLLDTLEVDYFTGGAGDMDYHAGHLWVCDSPEPYFSGPTDVRRIDPNTGSLVASYDLGIDHCTSLEWIDDDLWVCFRGPISWMVRQYTFDGDVFRQGVTYTLPSSMDWDIVWSVNIACDGTLLWVQEKGPCGNIHKIDLSTGSVVEVVSECDFTFNKWLGSADTSDICFSDGCLWAMNDDAPTFLKMTLDPNQPPPETVYTFAFDPNRNVFDDFGRYYGMVKHADLIYFIEGIDVTDADGTVIGRKHKIHTARIDQAHQSSRDLILKLGGQYWFGSLNVDVGANAPWAKRGTVSITGNQWDQEWVGAQGHHAFSSAFTTTIRPEGSIDIGLLATKEKYDVAWNGDLMIHAGSVLHGGGEGIDVFTRKATKVNRNDVLGDYAFLGHQVNSVLSRGDSCEWGSFRLDPNGFGTLTHTSDDGDIESATVTWTLDDVNATISITGSAINDRGHAELFLGKGGIMTAWQVVPEEGRSGDLGYAVFIKRAHEAIAMTDIAGAYQVRFLETGPGAVPYTCRQGTSAIEAVDAVNGVLTRNTYYSNGEHDADRIDCSVGPGNELHLADENTPEAILSPDKNLILIPEWRSELLTTRGPGDWLGGIFLVRTPNDSSAPPSGGSTR